MAATVVPLSLAAKKSHKVKARPPGESQLAKRLALRRSAPTRTSITQFTAGIPFPAESQQTHKSHAE